MHISSATLGRNSGTLVAGHPCLLENLPRGRKNQAHLPPEKLITLGTMSDTLASWKTCHVWLKIDTLGTNSGTLAFRKTCHTWHKILNTRIRLWASPCRNRVESISKLESSRFHFFQESNSCHCRFHYVRSDSRNHPAILKDCCLQLSTDFMKKCVVMLT